VNAAAIVALVALSTSGVVLAVLAVRLSSMARELANVRESLGRASEERTELRAALVEAGRANAVLERQLLILRERHAERLRFLRAQLEECTDPGVRGRIAVDGIRRILRSVETTRELPASPNRLLTDRDDAPTDG
jgi:septal ring factor EnvC (AmiA/AmiB activator)